MIVVRKQMMRSVKRRKSVMDKVRRDAKSSILCLHRPKLTLFVQKKSRAYMVNINVFVNDYCVGCIPDNGNVHVLCICSVEGRTSSVFVWN